MAKSKKEQLFLRGIKLKEELNSYDDVYYQTHESVDTDSDFDTKFNEYKEIEKRFPELKDENSPTVRIGAEIVSALEKMKHPVPLLSIDNKSQKIVELIKWYKSIGCPQLIVQPKFDGLTIDSNYENGKKKYDATRGNGYIGEVVSHNVKKIKSVLSEIGYKGYLEIRGEGIIPFDVFKKKFMKSDKNPDGYSNPRNMASGNFSRLDNTEFKESDVVYYDIGKFDNEHDFKLDTERLEFLKSLGFNVSPYIVISSTEELSKICTSYMNGLIQEDNGFNVLKIKDFVQVVCDGLVIKVNDLELREQLGMTNKGPRWAFAFKFKSLQAETILREVIWGIGRTGRLTPVAIFDNIMLGGVNITNATLNNEDFLSKLGEAYLDFDDLYVKDNSIYIVIKNKTYKIDIVTEVYDNEENIFAVVLDLSGEKQLKVSLPFNMELDDMLTEGEGKLNVKTNTLTLSDLSLHIGDKIIVERSNDVIPKVIGWKTVHRLTNPELTSIKVPDTCPDCGSPIYQEGILHFCRNLSCPAQLKRGIEQFASRDALNIMSLGDKIIDTFVEKGYIKNFVDIYNLKSYYDEIVALPKFGEKKVDKLLEAVESTKQVPFERVLFGLGIEGIGKKTAKTLVESFPSVKDLMNASKEDLLKVQDIGDITSETILHFFKNEQNVKLIEKLQAIGLQFEAEKKEVASDKFAGCTFVITGTLKENRDYYVSVIEDNNGKVSGSVSKKTTYVVVGTDAGSKETKALELISAGAGIKMIYGHEEFIKLMES